ncbi:phenylacetate-CoA oxygenase subunit PaaJ [Micromonospora sp. AMSO12t]|uniref:1,2-phenylacetyl-CoA epoxidase subunit PaaD n=1 Tax=unclassified Micromonospora TaxID=2617518 RepID=UPI00124BC858|nr:MULTISPECIES: 1,2-phenylacetyl-CoA epoxidase subunit PaaD [unclassified Micromonospora]KAB1139102.1 phenylacetate-CoA oxygenase subunit PaaJ [Micromonospora sp. AMSO12t]WSG05392.1 phenylacetate-CoA oxygenase subunit PaaJ [Micromonospora sp. NBC_01740]
MVTPREAVAAVVDPEIRVVTIDDLGILRAVDEDPATGRVVVTITPTYTGCPAMDVIRADIRRALAAAGRPEADVRTVYSPAWSTDWISDAGRAKLAAAGIAPPSPVRADNVVPLTLAVRCPRCGSPETEQVSRFGSTACKALWRCRSCREPFDHLKAL